MPPRAAVTTSRARTAPKGRATPQRPRQARPKGETISYNGQTYELADRIGVWPLMQLARAAQEGISSTDIRGLAALHAMFQDLLSPDDWPRFEADMIAAKMDDPMSLLATTQDAVMRIQERQARRKANGAIQGQVEA